MNYKIDAQASDDGLVGNQQAVRKSLLSLTELLAATGGYAILGCLEERFCFTSVATDSRNAVAGGMFVPLVGEFQDGHNYIPATLEKGISVVLVNKDFAKKSIDLIQQWHRDYPAVAFVAVDHTMYGLQDAAATYVKKFSNLIRIGVTGSSGKTTTKEIIASVLSTKYQVVMNQGNLNSETGLPLSVFEIRSHHEVGVFELGMNRRGEIAEIARVLSPSIGVITNIGTAHVGILGSKDAIAEEKKQIFANFSKESLALIPEMDSYKDFLQEGLSCRVKEYGPSQVNSVESLGLDGTRFSVDNLIINLPLPGKANFYDALAALMVAQELDLSDEQIQQGMAGVKPLFGRSQVIKGDITFIQDCYNANPDSMETALDFFADLELDYGRKILVVADMLELGDLSIQAHQRVLAQTQKTKASLMIFVGDTICEVANRCSQEESSQIVTFSGNNQETIDKVVLILKDFLKKGDVILLKGSRGMGLERITQALEGWRP